MGAMRSSSLPKALLTLNAMVCASTLGCGRKGDPIPAVRRPAQAPQARWKALRALEVTLPARDAAGDTLVGLEQVRLIWMPLGISRPSPQELLLRGEVVLERRRPDLPAPGGTLVMDLANLNRPAGWIVVVAVRVGEVPSAPSEVLPWLDSGL
jgi:hypothetical protein